MVPYYSVGRIAIEVVAVIVTAISVTVFTALAPAVVVVTTGVVRPIPEEIAKRQ